MRVTAGAGCCTICFVARMSRSQQQRLAAVERHITTGEPRGVGAAVPRAAHAAQQVRDLVVALAGTGFAADYTAKCYGLIPHKNWVSIDLAGVTSGQRENADAFAEQYDVAEAYETHSEMLAACKPDIDNIACANAFHGDYTKEAAESGVPVIVLEKPPVVWPGYREGRQADARVRKSETLAALAETLDAVRSAGSRLLYAEDFCYLDGVKGMVELLREAIPRGKGRILMQRGACGHQGSHAPAYDTPALSGGGSLLNKACHPLGPCLYLKQVEGILRDGKPIRPARVSATALQVMKTQPGTAGEHFRVMQNVDDFARITVVFEDETVAEVQGFDLSISGIHNELCFITDFAQYDIRVNPSNEHELFMPDGALAGDLLLREKLPTAQGTSFPRPNQFHAHGYVNEIDDAVECALDASRAPQSGPMLAWDTMVVLMAGYESSEMVMGGFVDVTPEVTAREFNTDELPDPKLAGLVFQRQP